MSHLIFVRLYHRCVRRNWIKTANRQTGKHQNELYLWWLFLLMCHLIILTSLGLILMLLNLRCAQKCASHKGPTQRRPIDKRVSQWKFPSSQFNHADAPGASFNSIVPRLSHISLCANIGLMHFNVSISASADEMSWMQCLFWRYGIAVDCWCSHVQASVWLRNEN